MQRILVVEDNKTLSKLFKERLEHQTECFVDCAYSYKEAVGLIGDDPSEYFIGLLDLNLPDAPDGEIVDYVLSKDIPVIVVTADFSDDARERIWSKKVVDYVLKDRLYNLEYITSLVNRIMMNKTTKVLVVDDAAVARKHIAKLLEVHQYMVFEARDGIEALNVLDDNPDIKLVISDYSMPNMDGFKLTTEIRGKYSKEHLAVIGISAHGSNDISTKFIKNGANDFLIKPFLKEEFYCRVTQNVTMIDRFKALEESEERFRLIYENAGNGIFLADPVSMKITSANRKMLDLLKYPSDEIKDKELRSFFKNKDFQKIEQFFKNAEIEDIAFSEEVQIIRSDMSIIDAEINSTFMVIDGEKCVIGIIEDISEKKRAEHEQKHKERLQGVFELAGAACHEINQPLQVISGYVELLLKEKEKAGQDKKKLAIIKEQVDKLNIITDKLQHITKYETTDYLNGKIIDIDKASDDNNSLEDM
ncbi:response regulator [candidate division KSB1 bacterium]